MMFGIKKALAVVRRKNGIKVTDAINGISL